MTERIIIGIVVAATIAAGIRKVISIVSGKDDGYRVGCRACPSVNHCLQTKVRVKPSQPASPTPSEKE